MTYIIVAFSSRALAMQAQQIFARRGIPVTVINTPREADGSCGLSVRANARLRAAVLRHWEGDEDAQGLLLEGAGGLHVPLNDSEDMLDLMESLGLPVLLVGGNYLGGLNHLLLSVEAVAARGLTLAGVILSDTQPAAREDEDTLAIRKDNEALLRRRLAGQGQPLAGGDDAAVVRRQHHSTWRFYRVEDFRHD